MGYSLEYFSKKVVLKMLLTQKIMPESAQTICHTVTILDYINLNVSIPCTVVLYLLASVLLKSIRLDGIIGL